MLMVLVVACLLRHSSSALSFQQTLKCLPVVDLKRTALTTYMSCHTRLSVARRTISERELGRKEQRALVETTKAWAQINQRASSEGQAIFDLFTKT